MNPESPAGKDLRSDGLEARTRLQDAALQLFADKGFAATSIREIALAAQVNVSAISYYFGDKAGLYRSLFQEPRINPAFSAPPAADLSAMLDAVLRGMTEPLKQGEAAQQCVKLFMREMLEPTGLWQAEIEHNIAPAHLALVQALCRHLQVAADDDLHRLAFSISGLGVMLQLSTSIYAQIRPTVLDSPEAVDAYTDRLLGYALAMVAAEADRRQGLPPSAPILALTP